MSDNKETKQAPAVEAGARDDDAAVAACALMIKGICLTRPQEVWVSDIKSRIRYMLAALARASEVGQVSKGWKLVPAEPTVEMLNAALPHDVTFGHGFKRRIYQEMIAAAPQPASEQQPIPQVFIDNGDASRKAFGQTVFAGMSNSDDLWPVWLDGWLRASEQQAARGLSDDDDCPSTPASERAAFNAMMRWHLIRLLQAWRYGGDMSAVALAAFEWARTNSVGKEAFKASERAVILAAKGDGQ